MREGKRSKVWISRMVIGVMVLQLAAPGISAAAESKADVEEAFSPQVNNMGLGYGCGLSYSQG